MATATISRNQKQKAKAKGKPGKVNSPVRFATFDQMKPSAVVPMLGETQSQFFMRASRALQRQIPSVNSRTEAVLKLWRESPEAKRLLSNATARFPSEKFTHFGPRCIFIEHVIPAIPESENHPGSPAIVYGQKQLEQLANWGNYRILDTGNYSAISDGHTPSKREREGGAPMPDVLGYSGPFYLAQIGDLEPKWAIYADEWVHNEDLPRFEKLQRRSPEVWVDEPMERRTMDPVAALGSSTPRLDSGMNAIAYCRDDGRNVMQYSAAGGPAIAGPVLPGPTNTFIPGGSGSGSKPKKKETRRQSQQQYAGDATMIDPAANGATGADDGQNTKIMQAVTAAFQSLLPSIVQATIENMSGEGGGDVGEGAADGDPDDDNPMDADDVNTGNPAVPRGTPQLAADDGDAGDDTGVPGAGDGDVPGDQDFPDAGDGADGDASEPKDPSEDEDANAAKYRAMGPKYYEAYQAGCRHAGGSGGGMKQNYSRSSSVARGNQSPVTGATARELHAAIAGLQKRLMTVENERQQERRDLIRYQRLSELSQEYAFDPADEHEAVRDFTDSQFERHCSSTVTKYSRRDDLGAVNFFDDPTLDPSPGREGGSGNGSGAGGRGSAGRNVSAKEVDRIEKYSRQAAQQAASKNAKKKGSTTFEQEFDAICKQHGMTV